MIQKNYPSIKDFANYKTLIKNKLKNKKLTCSKCKKQIKSTFAIYYKFRENSQKYAALYKSKKPNPKLMESLYTDLRFVKLTHKQCELAHRQYIKRWIEDKKRKVKLSNHSIKIT